MPCSTLLRRLPECLLSPPPPPPPSTPPPLPAISALDVLGVNDDNEEEEGEEEEEEEERGAVDLVASMKRLPYVSSMHVRQKSPDIQAKETYGTRKRDPIHKHNSPTIQTKETYCDMKEAY